MKVYLVYFFSHYLNMYDPMYNVKHVVLSEEKAIELVEAQNERLKKRLDYNRDRDAFFECHNLVGDIETQHALE